MKKVIFALGVALLFATQACSQSVNEKKVPENVKTAFTQKFANAKKIKWEKESETEWEASFHMDNKEYSANFTSDGTWTETEYEIGKSEIPAAVQQTLGAEFAGYNIKEIEVLENSQGTFYEIELKKDKSEIEVVIDPNGKVIKQESQKEDEEE